MEIPRGPHFTDGLVWWEVLEFGAGLLDWTAEGDDDGYWLMPCDAKGRTRESTRSFPGSFKLEPSLSGIRKSSRGKLARYNGKPSPIA